MTRQLGVIVVLAMVAVGAAAEPFRTLFLTDDQILDLGGMELGVQLENIDSMYIDSAETISVYPYLRYGLFDKMTAYVKVPFTTINSDIYPDEAGLGDMDVGVHLLAEDGVEGSCSIMLTMGLSLPTGDEENRLGSGDVGLDLGIAFGIDLEPDTTVILDGSYKIVADGVDVFTYGVGVVYEINPRLHMTVETKGTDQEFEEGSPAVLTAGMSYKGFCGVKGLMIAFAGGGGLTEASPDGVGGLKMAYTF